MLLLLAGSELFGWVDWAAVGRWVSGYELVLVLAAGGLAFVVVGIVRGLTSHKVGRRPPLSWWAIAAGVALVIGVVWGTTGWLLAEAGRSKTDPAAARVEAVKTGFGIGAGTGGVLALLLAVRRQWHQEVTAADTQAHQEQVAEDARLDAGARRVTELYTKAAEQLGSDKAPVRLAGLYALERLAQDNPTQRQTIVNVLCAYLRMPYTQPGDPPADNAEEKLAHAYRERTQEREVRLAAQSILAHHLRPGPSRDNPVETFWPGIDLNLSGAALVQFALDRCTMHDADFRKATFTEGTWFDEAIFTGKAWFRQAIFIGDAKFRSATFTDGAWFRQATFTGNARFEGSTFVGDAKFGEVTFTGNAAFTDEAAHTDDAKWGDTTFKGNANFDRSTFTSAATFGKDSLPSTRYLDDKTSSPWTNFSGAQFARKVPAEVARFVSAPSAGDAPGSGTHPVENR
ncbi:pentapeptide repeat-containing protein [Actinokineospora soli]|uniref:Pentapeptide repeat-containing protein n=1 Tax=Actinokineospora soli TaxID=1048753 RepID=A0ABW2TNI3_9PSEU